jgi:two-component system chemotaxis sensor kinase CheA
MDQQQLEAILEGLATSVVMAEPNDPSSLDNIKMTIEELRAVQATLPAPLAELARSCLDLAAKLEIPDGDHAPTLAGLGDAVARFQKLLSQPNALQDMAAAPTPPPTPEPEALAEVAAPMTSAPPAAPTTVMRDEETVGLIGEFLSESEEGLSRADQILINVEQSGSSADAVNGLFRVFHTVKGVAGFLELPEITSLAHTTETLLNRCREGAVVLADERLDVVFDATAMVRRMLGELRTAVQDNRQFATAEDLESLLAHIRTLTEVSAAPAPAAPAPVAVAPVAPIAATPITAAPVPATPPAPVSSPTAEAAPSLLNTSEHPAVDLRLTSELPVVEARPEPSSLPAAEMRPEPQAAPVAENRPEPQSAPAAEARPEGQAMTTAKLRETVKVDLERVDSLVEMVGELVVVESMVVNAPEIAKSASARVRNCLSQLAKVTRDLQDVGMRMRMLPVAGVFQKMQRIARDLARKTEKQVRIVLSGETTEMDRSMVEQIADPLVHMIRNAVDHGLEPSAARVAAGKPAEGTIRLAAYHEGGSIIIELADDGRGLDRDAILAKARSQGIIGPRDELSDAEIHSLIFAPGFSTAKKVTEVSGRGVGMDVVKRNLDAMRGRVTISTVPGSGTTFKLMLPLTLAIIDGMLVASGQDRYIIPTLSIIESIQPDARMLVTFAGDKEMINVRGEILPLVRLDRLFGITGARTDPTQALVVIVEGVGSRIGLLVDEVITQQQVVIKSLGPGLSQARYLSGAAILADGRVGLIVNVEEIAAQTSDKRRKSIRDGAVSAPQMASNWTGGTW